MASPVASHSATAIALLSKANKSDGMSCTGENNSKVKNQNSKNTVLRFRFLLFEFLTSPLFISEP